MSVPVPMYGFGGGGGTSLNFDVKAYATEEALLAATPKENTIGIITTNKITGWMLTPGDIEGNKQSANLYTTTSATTGAYLDDDGSEVSNNTYLITKYIQLPDNTKSLTATFPYTDEDVIAFYNSDKTFISTVQYEEGLATYSVPDGTRYIRVSYHVDKEPPTIYANYVVAQDFAEGTVLIQTGTDSKVGFNALKKNGIQVYPLSAKQYVSGALVDVTAMIYQAEEWVEFTVPDALYWYGDECEGLTGGWTKVNGTLTKNTDNLVLTNSGASISTYAAVYTSKKVNLTNFSKINAVALGTYSIDQAGGGTKKPGCYLVVASSQNTSKQTVAETTLPIENMEKITLDVSGISGSYYIGFLAAGSSAVVHTATVQTVLMEV